jgi:hypothetical protein
MEYKVYCEFCGHKKKISVEAINASQAKKAVQDMLVFYKIERYDEKVKEEHCEVVENLMGILGIKK